LDSYTSASSLLPAPTTTAEATIPSNERRSSDIYFTATPTCRHDRPPRRSPRRPAAHDTARACCAPAAQPCCMHLLPDARRTPRQISLSSLCRTPHAHPCARRHASPCTEQGCSYVLRRRPREGAFCRRSRLPAASHRLANPTLFLAHASRHWYLMAQPLVTRALFAPATPLPAPRESWHNPTLFAHMPSPCSRHGHCFYCLLCLLVGTMINLPPSSTPSRLTPLCPTPPACCDAPPPLPGHSPSPRPAAARARPPPSPIRLLYRPYL